MGKIPILTHIFQMGWNHQLDSSLRRLPFCFCQHYWKQEIQLTAWDEIFRGILAKSLPDFWAKNNIIYIPFRHRQMSNALANHQVHPCGTCSTLNQLNTEASICTRESWVVHGRCVNLRLGTKILGKLNQFRNPFFGEVLSFCWHSQCHRFDEFHFLFTFTFRSTKITRSCSRRSHAADSEQIHLWRRQGGKPPKCPREPCGLFDEILVGVPGCLISNRSNLYN